ncbi:peroxiredoxin [Hymenobacter rubripertinctus]|uniref:Peroxiredoxin n=1 Tax=Hymenobacter rubripertinctus TaxID=2029981 RepID=A0A418QJX6_9BACT|nr:peroxiredoxin [Hymenobacter rubripertinctus]RIY05440.1 peroxiredoxin [Hymenobacter rubripertinctus]
MDASQPAITMPSIGSPAPDFEALSTTGRIKFSDFAPGKWVVFFSHPADFTPVCTTEMSGFAARQSEFTALNAALLGLSIDSIHAHIAWVNNVREKSGVYFRFPIIADIDMKVARLYGMLQPGASETAAVRAVFFIDPAHIVRLIMYYPMSVGRNMDEILRVLQAMQFSDAHKVSLPLDWQPGEKVILPAPQTLDQLDARLADDSVEKMDFYLATKQL